MTPQSKATILVLDDDQAVRDVLRRHLEAAGFAVQTAESGALGLALLERETVALVITDIYMPDMDGVEFIARLQGINARLPVIAVSGGGYASSDDVLEIAERMGAKATLAKPVERDALLAAVKQALAD